MKTYMIDLNPLFLLKTELQHEGSSKIIAFFGILPMWERYILADFFRTKFVNFDLVETRLLKKLDIEKLTKRSSNHFYI